jgi:formylglycine-generating enzyme required for sulfatase activity
MAEGLEPAATNLLFGILALQNNFVDRAGLLDGFNRWIEEKSRSLGEILVERGALGTDECQLLDALVAKHLANFDDDPRKCLAALSSVASAREDLTRIADPDIQASLIYLALARNERDDDPLRTVTPPSLGTATSELTRFRILRPHAKGGLGQVSVALDQRDPAEHSARFRELLRRFTDVCNAVAYAHSRGILHRDLKPGNIMLGPYGETLVVDWGLAKVLGGAKQPQPEKSSDTMASLPVSEGPIRLSGQSGSPAATVAGAPIGTPSYASPEQVAGKLGDLGPASDVYGLGAILYCLLTGQSPAQGDSPADVIRRVERGEIPSPRSVDPTIPKPLESICRKAMAFQPVDRYPSARALAKDVDRWLDDLPVSSYREPALIRARRWLRKHRTAGAAALSGLLVTALGLMVLGWAWRRAEQVEQNRARNLSYLILTLDLDSVIPLVASLGPSATRVTRLLAPQWQSTNLEPAAKIRVALALAPSLAEARAYLEQQVYQADPRTLRIIAEGLRTTDSRSTIERFWKLTENLEAPTPRRFRATCALAILDPPQAVRDQDRWQPHIDWTIREALNSTTFSGDEFDRTFSPLGSLYLHALARCCRDDYPQRARAFELLHIHANDAAQRGSLSENDLPASLVVDAEPDDLEWLLTILEQSRELAIERLTAASGNPDELFASEPTMKGHSTANRRARALVALVRMGSTDRLWPALRRAGEPNVRTALIHDLARYRVDPTILIQRFTIEPDPSVRAALVLSLGGYDPRRIKPTERQTLTAAFLDSYRRDPDSEIRGAVAWLLRARWDNGGAVGDVDQALRSREPLPDSRWFVNLQGQAFTVVRGPKRFVMGTPTTEKDRVSSEVPHEREIPRSFAIATTEVTVGQYLEFVKANKNIFTGVLPFERRISPDDSCPMHGVSWVEAVLYCRWLSDKEHIPEAEMCFPPLAELKPSLEQGKLDLGMRRLNATGYRLPSEAEWEFSCRAGVTSPRFFGRAAYLFADYAWFSANSGVADPFEAESQGRTRPVGSLRPNDLGLFDVYGNVREWCLDSFERYPNAGKVLTDTTFRDPATVDDWNRVARGGSFADPLRWVRSAYRNGWAADQHLLSTGFRVARTVR